MDEAAGLKVCKRSVWGKDPDRFGPHGVKNPRINFLNISLNLLASSRHQ
jgi:hypothetical protein